MDYRIVCTEQEPVGAPPQHAHIVAVGTGDDANKSSQRYTLAEVIRMMDRGDRFYTKGERSGRIALVIKVACSRCGHTIIKSAPDAVQDNNLDSLRYCRFNAAA